MKTSAAPLRVRHEVKPNTQVDALLLAVHAEPAEPQLDLGQLADALLLGIRHAVLS
ncbi:hypothetical protein [Micromonospora sp. NPDC023814]|uniref:hypothetical protein n=1 Tax=Micromonospora sp. NPDC023814 TaxID=3154596 RepID=UPI003406B508